MTVWLDGAWVSRDEARISIDDRGFLLGDGVFETARLYDGRFFRFHQHMERLHAGAALLRLSVPATAELFEIARELARRNDDARHAMLRVTLTRGRSNGEPTRLLTLTPLPRDWRHRAEAGWSVVTAGVRHPPPSVNPAGLKWPGRLFSLLGRIEAREAGVDDALLLSVDGDVAEGPTWNVFWRHGRRLRTPDPATGILQGVTRSVVMELAGDAGFTVEQGLWPRTDLDDADEIFATMSSLGLVAFRSLDGRDLPAPRAVPELRRRYWSRVEAELEDA